jgi:hypothetical protein
MKKQTNYTPYIILAAAGIAGFVFRKQIGNILGFNKKQDGYHDSSLDLIVPEPTPPTPTPTITPDNVLPPPKVLSPIGTPKEKLQMDTKLELGDKGQEVTKLQQILNRFNVLNSKQTISEDGSFGVQTQSNLTNTIGGSSISLREAYYALYAYWNARNVGKTKDWYKYFYKAYFNDKTRLDQARKNYFAKNLAI